jgi:hypothetical protein
LFSRRVHLQKYILLVFLLTAIFSADRILFSLNNSYKHKEFIEFYELKRSFNDKVYGEYFGERTNDAIDKTGWTPDDYWFFRMWNTYDNRLFNADTLRFFLKGNNPTGNVSLMSLVWSRWKNIAVRYKHYILIFLFTTLSLISYKLIDFLRLSSADKIKILISLGIVGSGILFLMFYRFPPRIQIPLFSFSIGLVFLLFNKKMDGRKNISLFMISLLFLLLTLGHSYFQGRKNLRFLYTSRLENAYIQNCLMSIRREQHRAPILVMLFPIFSHGIGIEKIHPFKDSTDITTLADLSINPINSPRYFHALKNKGLRDGHAFMRWTIDNGNVLFVFFDRGKGLRNKIMDLWESYYNRRIVENGQVIFQKAYDFRNEQSIGLVFYRMAKNDL